MNYIEKIILAIIFVITILVSFDFIIYVLKSAPKQSYFSKLFWRLGFLSLIILVYWYINNMKFI